MSRRVVCAGHVNWDVTLQVDRLPEEDGEAHIGKRSQGGGGSASNTATLLSGLDCKPLLFGSTGDDELATRLQRELSESGVDCTHIRRVEGETTVKYLVVDEQGEVMVLANDGRNEAFEATDLPVATLEETNHLHLTSQDPETAAELTTRAHDAGATVSIDPGRRIDARDFSAAIERADLLLVNNREAAIARDRGLISVAVKRDETDAAVTRGETDAVGDAPSELAGGLTDVEEQIVVVKHGGDGATVHADGRRVTHDGFDVDVVDTTGAGDAFAGGFLAASLVGADLADALVVGNACGAIAVQTVGARVSASWTDIALFCDLPFLDS